ncbi:hypothetical protein NM688_g9273 [Phlebia brevispora]|uniref:Uncharacterized protein n=1 Tax=Phlebia brevispora TaxID=194682 RepID=A0ACC1RKZ6_9APHY|nr:hypothetical protein NM688_g9273 [Phlebia brevispora]
MVLRRQGRRYYSFELLISLRIVIGSNIVNYQGGHEDVAAQQVGMLQICMMCDRNACRHTRVSPTESTSQCTQDIKLTQAHGFHATIGDDEEDGSVLPWEEKLAQKYHSSLYREFATRILKHYKPGNVPVKLAVSRSALTNVQFALRWRTEEEAVSGAGETTGRNTRCPLHSARNIDPEDPRSALRTLELPFSVTLWVTLSLFPTLSCSTLYAFPVISGSQYANIQILVIVIVNGVFMSLPALTWHNWSDSRRKIWKQLTISTGNRACTSLWELALEYLARRLDGRMKRWDDRLLSMVLLSSDTLLRPLSSGVADKGMFYWKM